MKSILSIIFISYLFMNPISDSMNINSLSISAKSSAMGGVYIPLGANQTINFSHLSQFGGIYTLDALQYNNMLFIVHGIENIPNTLDAWTYNAAGPNAHEIDYSKISDFDAKDYNFIFSRIIKNQYNISLKSTVSKIYNEFGYGLGFNVLTTKKNFKGFNYYLGLYDILSFKIWTNKSISENNMFELYVPQLMFSLERSFLQSLNVLTLYSLYNDENNNIIDYRFGSRIRLTENLDVLFGKSTFNKFAFGFSISDKLFNMDYSYIVSSEDLPFENSYNISIGFNISELVDRSKEFYP